MPDEARRRVGLQEAKLIGALTVRSPAPTGMDLQRVAVTRRQLALKRLRIVARAWPSLRQVLGEDFERVGFEVLGEVPMTPRHQAVADGLAIAEHCRDAGRHSDAVSLALLHVRAHWIGRAASLRPRRLPWLGIAQLPDSDRIAVAARLIRTYIWILP
jgi:hypothetical protein